MFKFEVKGRTLEETKKALMELVDALNGGVVQFAKNTKVEVTPDEEEYVDESEISTNVTPISTKAGSVNSAPAFDMSDLDSKGTPWNKDLHASSRAKIADGTWRVKRGVSDEAILAYNNQFRSSVSVVQTTSNPVIQPVVQPVVVPAPMPTMNSGHTLQTFSAQFPVVIGNLISQGKIDQDYVNSLKAHYGLAEIWMANEAQKAEMFEFFAQHKLIVKVG